MFPSLIEDYLRVYNIEGGSIEGKGIKGYLKNVQHFRKDLTKKMKLKNKQENCRFVFAGDLLSADREHTLGIGVSSKIDHKELLWSDQVSALLQQGDITLVNLEGPIVANTDEIDKFSFAGNPKLLDYLIKAGTTHAHVANNHILEHGSQVFTQTVSLLKSVGIEPIGDMENAQPRVVITERNGLNIAFAGFNAIHDIPNPDCYSELSEQSMKTILQSQAMQKADIRVLVFHWGNEYIHIPSWDQIQLARKAIDEGAHLVVGHHPHVIQPVEEYNNGLICYSLGNFLFDMIWNQSVRTGALLEVEVRKNHIESWHIRACRYDKSYFVALLPSDWIEIHLRKWTDQMQTLQLKGEAHYKKNYNKHVKRQRFFNRILMKKQLLQQLPYMPGKQRMQIIKSLFRKVFKT